MINLAIKNSAYSSLIVKKQNERFKDINQNKAK